uniref:Uncharacterized protein n=1 Tax=Setaria italica TaxID=4555 RepID=K4A301_SETIT
MRFNVGAKGFTLYRHTEFGIVDVREGLVVKDTSLYRNSRTSFVPSLKGQGLLTWPTYKENCPRILRLLASLHDALRKYKERCLKDGFFYLVPSPHKYAISARSPLFSMSRSKATKKIRLLHHKREAF